MQCAECSRGTAEAAQLMRGVYLRLHARWQQRLSREALQAGRPELRPSEQGVEAVHIVIGVRACRRASHPVGLFRRHRTAVQLRNRRCCRCRSSWRHRCGRVCGTPAWCCLCRRRDGPGAVHDFHPAAHAAALLQAQPLAQLLRQADQCLRVWLWRRGAVIGADLCWRAEACVKCGIRQWPRLLCD